MEGTRLAPGQAHRRVVMLADGSVLNRYWDDCDTPREESYGQDVETARASGRPAAEVYRNLRAGAESGWDYSSRWLADGRTLATIRTIDIVPPDLNSLLHHLELTLVEAYRVRGRRTKPRNCKSAPMRARRRYFAICGTRRPASSPTTCGRRGVRPTTSPRRRCIRCSSASPSAARPGRWRNACASLAPAAWACDDDHRDRTTVG